MRSQGTVAGYLPSDRATRSAFTARAERAAGGRARRWRGAGASAIIGRSRMIPDVLHIGPVPIHLFGIFLALAFLAAGAVAAREFERKGYEPELASSMVVWAALGGLVGARLWIVLEAWPEFVAAPLTFVLTGGGFVWYGGLVGGAFDAGRRAGRLLDGSGAGAGGHCGCDQRCDERCQRWRGLGDCGDLAAP